MNRKGLLGDLAQSLLADTMEEKEKDLQRGDKVFQKFRNKVIRRITIQPVGFGVSIQDTSRKMKNKLTHLANQVHRTTRPFVAKNQLFFHENERLSPFLLANNERYLRDLPFLQDARIVVKPVKGKPDSVDVTIFVKDVLSLGGSIDIKSHQSAILEIREDNFLGYGDRLSIQTMYDRPRERSFGYGLSYLKRNILGTFIDANLGYLNFNRAFNSGKREENVVFMQLLRPLINPNARWTYALITEWHSTSNMFSLDSVYENDLRYQYRIHDGWVGWNPSYKLTGRDNEASAFRYLIALRMMDQQFTEKPLQYKNEYNYAFANLYAMLGSLSIYRQNFYKTQYIYGFGRKEDLPQGVDGTITGGFTKKDTTTRPYVGLNFNLNYVTNHERFINYTFAFASSFDKGKSEDLTLLGNIEYFGKLHHWKSKWKQRTFLTAHFTRQFNSRLDEPLFLESRYGIQGYDNLYLPGHIRATLKAESVFYTPNTLLFFKFAPFIFGSTTYFKEQDNGERLIPVIGGGLRIRNESLIFGTIEIKGSYFTEKDRMNNRFVFQLRSNIRYKYNQNFIRRPEFIQLN